MKFSVGAIVAFAAAALAKPVLLNSNYEIQEDVPFTFKWSGAEGPVTLTLMTGPSKALVTVTTIATDETGTSFTWTPTDLPSGTYAIRITDESGEPNYSAQFEYEGTGTLPTTSASSSVSITSSAEPTTTTESSSSTTEESSTETETSTETSTTSSEESTTTTLSTSTTTSASSTPTDSDDAEETFAPINTNNGQRFASPLALVLVTVAALVFFN